MGDCRLRILVAKELLHEIDCDASSTSSPSLSSTWQSQTRIFSADTTIREVFEEVLLPLKWKNNKVSPEELPEDVRLWDCTLHPPKNITEWPCKDFPEKIGSKSKTLYDAGWFPSGILQIVHSNQGEPKLASKDMYDDMQYNIATKVGGSKGTGAVLLTGEIDSGTMKPSEVMKSVQGRFDGDKQISETDALSERRQKLMEQKQKESKRNRKLEDRIQQLNQSNSSTSKQVRRMLIKNRCTGARLMDVKDRVYLHCVGISGDTTKEDYCYFSRQDTVTKVISSLKKPLSLPLNRDAELLVKSHDARFRRLPPTMRLYEALSQDYLQDVDSILIRSYSSENEEPTTSVLEDNTSDSNNEPVRVETTDSTTMDKEKNETTMDTKTEDISEDFSSAHITRVLQALDDAEDSKRKKNKSATSAKVRSMLMKSKASGDKKRVSKMTDRFFLEMVLFYDCDDDKEPSIKPIFIAKTDQVGRVLRDFVPSISSELRSMVITPCESSGFQNIPLEVTWQEAEKKGLIKQYDRIIIRLYK